MKGRSLYGAVFAVSLAVLGLAEGTNKVESAEEHTKEVVVFDYEELKKGLETPGRAEISVAASIDIDDTIFVKGEKIINGNGYTLSRSKSGGGIFGGTLLSVQKGQVLIRNLLLSGGGSSDKIQRNVFGRLIDIRSGMVTLETGTVLTENINQKYNHDGGGAVLIKDGGKLTMNGGRISDNRNVSGGAGVHIKRGGEFVMKGGTITGNQSFGIGAVEGFDGRGGAIYNQGKTTISGGSIKHNRVKGFTSSGMSYGGVGGMLYNQGECWIQGGNVTGNSASYGGGAVYSDRESMLRITGGTIRGNAADLGEGLFLSGGSCRMGGVFYLPDVYLAKGTVVTAEDSLSLKGYRIHILPEKYEIGICLVKTSGKIAAAETMFSLERRGRYMLVSKKKSLCIGRKKDIRPRAVPKSTDGSIQKLGKGREKKKTAAGVVSGGGKKMASVRAAPRYFFVWEVRDYTEEKWGHELLAGCEIRYGDQKKEEIQFQWKWNGLLQNKAGSYQAEVSVKDGDWTVIPVTLVQESTEEEKAGYVRFQTSGKESKAFADYGESVPEEVWCFPGKDIRRIYDFMRKREDPFSSATNQEFLNLFQKYRIS